MHKIADSNNKSEIISELSRIQSESYFNVPQNNDKLEKPSPAKVYFTGTKDNAKNEQNSFNFPKQDINDFEQSSGNMTSS